jgi:hypothetical protein
MQNKTLKFQGEGAKSAMVRTQIRPVVAMNMALESVIILVMG